MNSRKKIIMALIGVLLVAIMIFFYKAHKNLQDMEQLTPQEYMEKNKNK